MFPNSFDKVVRPISSSMHACITAPTVLQASTRQIKLQAGLYMIYISIPNATGRCSPLDCPKLSILSPPPPPPLSSDICKCRHIQGRFSVVLGESGSGMPGLPVCQCTSAPACVCARRPPLAVLRHRGCCQRCQLQRDAHDRLSVVRAV